MDRTCGPLSASAWRRLLPACVLLAALGCGLRDYEAHIDAQRERLKIFDEENRYLGDPIEAPRYKVKKDGVDGEMPFWPFDVFLRLPKDFTSDIRDKCQFNYQDLPLFRYAGNREGYNAFVAAGLVVDKKEADKDKAGQPRPRGWPAGTFREYVRAALMEFYVTEYKVIADFPAFDRKLAKVPVQPVDDRGVPQPAIPYEAIAFTDQFNRGLKEFSLFRVYFLQQDGKQVSLIFQFPTAWDKDDNLNKAIDWSLKSLEVGGGAYAKRVALEKRKKKS